AANVSFRGWTISPSPCSTRTTLPPTKPDIRNTTSRIRPERRKPFLGKPVKTDEWGNGFLENAQHHFRRIKASGDETIRRLSDDEWHRRFHREVNSACARAGSASCPATAKSPTGTGMRNSSSSTWIGKTCS